MAKAKVIASTEPTTDPTVIITDEIAAAAKAGAEAAEKALAEMDAAAAALNNLPPAPPLPPAPFAVFRYRPYAQVNSTFVSGVPVLLQFDAEGLFHCADNQWYSAVCRASVDPDLPPGHISQVTE